MIFRSHKLTYSEYCSMVETCWCSLDICLHSERLGPERLEDVLVELNELECVSAPLRLVGVEQRRAGASLPDVRQLPGYRTSECSYSPVWTKGHAYPGYTHRSWLHWHLGPQEENVCALCSAVVSRRQSDLGIYVPASPSRKTRFEAEKVAATRWPTSNAQL